MKAPWKNLATPQQKQAERKFKIEQPLFKELIFKPILHRFQSNVLYYTSCALVDVLCQYSVIWIKINRAVH